MEQEKRNRRKRILQINILNKNLLLKGCENMSLNTVMSEMLKNKVATEYDLQLIKTFDTVTQKEFCEKMTNKGWTLVNCLAWYNSYS
jgi:fructose-1,6-bisphosphatase